MRMYLYRYIVLCLFLRVVRWYASGPWWARSCGTLFVFWGNPWPRSVNPWACQTMVLPPKCELELFNAACQHLRRSFLVLPTLHRKHKERQSRLNRLILLTVLLRFLLHWNRHRIHSMSLQILPRCPKKRPGWLCVDIYIYVFSLPHEVLSHELLNTFWCVYI